MLRLSLKSIVALVKNNLGLTLAIAMSVALLTSLVLALVWTSNLGTRLIRRGKTSSEDTSSTTGFFGFINLIALRWPPEYQRWIVGGNVYAYGAFELLAIAVTLSRSKRYGRGTLISHFLWIAQGGWGVATLL